MAQVWLPFTKHYDLSRSKGYGPFNPGRFLGVIVHVNVGKTGDAFFANNPEDVCPNFQVDADGTIHQYLPLDWQPWCQRDGNSSYAAIETEGYPSQPYTPAQVSAIGALLAAYYTRMGMPLRSTDVVGERGVGTHRMGGEAWGGHSCPGDLRANQRKELLAAAAATVAPAPAPATATSTPITGHVPPWPGPALRWGTGDYFGLVTGPAASHGGYHSNERPYVAMIQRRLQLLGFAPRTAGWADGRYEQPTADAVAAWQRARWAKFTSRYGEVWSDDWARLFG